MYYCRMAWEGIEGRLKNALSVKVSIPGGMIWLPASHLSIDDWLTSIAQTDEELRELNIPRIRFLQNRWRLVPLMELEWDDQFSNRRAIVAMYAGRCAYILFSDWNQYQVIAAVEPKDNPSLYRTVIGQLLENRSFVPTWPTHIRNRRPDLVPEFVTISLKDPARNESLRHAGWMDPDSKREETWKAFLSEILVGWIGQWLHAREVGIWHEDTSGSAGEQKRKKVSAA
jgi:hypothetical protein